MKLRYIPLLAILCLALTSVGIAQNVLYDDGPTNGFTNGYFIDGPNPGPFSQSISDGFTATGSGAASSFVYGEWVISGTTPTTVTWWLGTSAFGGDLGTGTTPINGSNSTFLNSNSYGYDVYEVTVAGLTGNITAGNTYYLTLGNANDSGGTQFDAWDENGGAAACYFAVGGVEQGSCGSGPQGEAFTLYSSSGTVPEPSSLLLLGSGVLGLAGFMRRRIGL